jgi:tetratricopeptide (TPR) repeat protein
VPVKGSSSSLKLILRTFASVFEHVTLWKTMSEDILILGSSSALELDFNGVSERFNLQLVREDLQRIEITSLPTLFSLQIASDSTVRKMAGRGRLNEDHNPILEYEAPKAFFLGSIASMIRSHDDREMPVEANSLYLMSYLRERKDALSREELKNFTAFHRTNGTKKILKGAVNEWVIRFPEDREALWQLVQVQQADGQMESALTTLTPLLNDEPGNPAYLMMAADLELSSYLTQRSYLNHTSNKRTLALLERLLEVDIDNKVRIYRKIAQVYAADRNYATSLGYLEQAAEYSIQNERNDITADALWVEAAAMAMEMEEFGKAHVYLRKALAQNPQNPSAKQLLRELPILDKYPQQFVNRD